MVKRLYGSPIPYDADFWDVLYASGERAEEFDQSCALHGFQFLFENSLANRIVLVDSGQTVRIGMNTEAADERVDGVEASVAEEAHPELEIAGTAAGRVHVSANAVPQAAPPEGGFLLNVFVRTCEEAVSRPTRQVFDAKDHSSVVGPTRAAGNPFDLRVLAKDAADDGERTELKLVCGADPAHDFAGRRRKTFVNRVVHAVVWLANIA